MSIGPAVEDHEQDRFDWNIQSGETASKVFTVDFTPDEPRITMTSRATGAQGMPQRLQPHPGNQFLIVGSHNVTKIPPNRCVVVVNYVSARLNLSQVQPPNVIKRRWFFSATQEEIDQDIHGMPILNSAAEYFESPISRTFNDIAGQFTYRTVNYDLVFADSFMDTVNSGQFLGFAPGVAKLVAFDGEEIENEDGNNWNISIEIHFRTKGPRWNRRILDQGYRRVIGTAEDGTLDTRAILDGEGEPIRSPMPLDGNGRPKQREAPASYLLFEVLESTNFDLLNLG